MPADIFIDSNIIIYAHDADAGMRHKIAKRLIRELWEHDRYGHISVQVLQEVFVNLVRHNVKLRTAQDIVKTYSVWPVIENTVSLLEHGMAEMSRWKLSFWDGMILAAARQSGASVLWSEDFNTGQNYGGIEAVNPLVMDSA